jgi:hypothetical protein
MLTVVLAHQTSLQLQWAVVQEALARLPICLKGRLRVTVVPHLQIVCINKKFSFLSSFFYCSFNEESSMDPKFQGVKQDLQKSQIDAKTLKQARNYLEYMLLLLQHEN